MTVNWSRHNPPLTSVDPAGPSKVNQIIGLSQGLLDLKFDAKGVASAEREPIVDGLFDAKTKQPTTAEPIEMSLSQLRAKVQLVLGPKGAKE